MALGGTLYQDINTQIDGSLVHRNWDVYEDLHQEVVLEEGSALREIRSEGPIKKLLGLYIIGNRVARSGYPLMHENRQVGHITSGTYSPTLDRNIALGYLQTDLIDNHKGLKCDIRGQLADVEVTALPFYSRNT